MQEINELDLSKVKFHDLKTFYYENLLYHSEDNFKYPKVIPCQSLYANQTNYDHTSVDILKRGNYSFLNANFAF